MYLVNGAHILTYINFACVMVRRHKIARRRAEKSQGGATWAIAAPKNTSSVDLQILARFEQVFIKWRAYFGLSKCILILLV